jgi:hypothetical protein
VQQRQSDNDSFRLSRLADFRRRADYAPNKVYRHRSRSWEYIPIHPFGDEPDDLRRLNLKATDCHSADAWWAIDGDRTLLESRVVRVSNGQVGLYAAATPHDDRSVFLHAVFDADYVSRHAFEGAMVNFAEAGFPLDQRFRLRWGDPLLVVLGGSAAA